MKDQMQQLIDAVQNLRIDGVTFHVQSTSWSTRIEPWGMPHTKISMEIMTSAPPLRPTIKRAVSNFRKRFRGIVLAEKKKLEKRPEEYEEDYRYED